LGTTLKYQRIPSDRKDGAVGVLRPYHSWVKGDNLTARWLIFKNDKTLGPVTAEEIRTLLREGEVDPFDMVAQEGSSLRRELVEVDEIFAQSSVSQFGVAQRTRAAGTSSPDELTKTLPPSGFVPNGLLSDLGVDGSANPEGLDGAGVLVGNGQLFLAQPDLGQGSGDNGARIDRARPRARNPKIYHILDDRGRVQGPLAATDILRLYYKGILGQGIYVVRRDSKLRIPVERFVAVLARQQVGSQGQQGRPGRGYHPGLGRPDHARVGGLVPGLRLQLMGVPTSFVAMFLILLAILVGVASAWLVLGSGLSNKSPRRERNEISGRDVNDKGLSVEKKLPKRSPAKNSTKESPAQQIRDNLSAKGRSREVSERERGVASRRPSMQSAQRPFTKGAKSSGSLRAVEREAKKSSTLAAKSRLKASSSPSSRMGKSRSQSRPSVAQLRRSSPSAPSRVAVARPFLPPARPLISPRPPVPPAGVRPTLAVTQSQPPGPSAPRVAPPPPGGGGQSTLGDGQTVSGIGPFTFDRNAVAQCQAACTVVFKGPMGVVTGKFFKSIWGPILLEKNGPVRLSGLIRKVGPSTKIIISDIQ
jgi:hypothetical protein